ncbi:MAG: phosphate ABC transporter permease family protein, partial [Pseudomonadota bacterium]
MPLYWLILTILAIACAGYVLGRARALSSAGGDFRGLHSLPSYYGYNVALSIITPAFAVMILWLLVQPLVIERQVSAFIPEGAIAEGSSLDLVMSDVRRVAGGLTTLIETGRMTADGVAAMTVDNANIRERLGEVGVALGSNVQQEVLEAARSYRDLSGFGGSLMWAVVLLVAAGGFAVSYAFTQKDFRARNTVETGVLVVLIAAASI